MVLQQWVERKCHTPSLYHLVMFKLTDVYGKGSSRMCVHSQTLTSHQNCLLLFVKHSAMCILTSKYQIREQYTDILLVNTPCSHLHSFCTTGLSSGLATRVTFTQVSWERLEQSIIQSGPASDFVFIPYYVIVVRLDSKLYTLYILQIHQNVSTLY
jgi:hypothetical protein